ncbi:MAG: nuclear transport factor 2 family protein [Candidatus Longimicrobiales bacterium M2_2A_002]
MPANRDLVQSLYDAFARGDAGTVLGAMHENVDWNEAEGGPYADQNPYSSPQQVGEGVFGRLMEEFDGFTVTPHKLVADGETVVAFGRYTGTHRASGRPLDAQFAHEWIVRDGRVVGFQQYTDTAQYQQLRASAT